MQMANKWQVHFRAEPRTFNSNISNNVDGRKPMILYCFIQILKLHVLNKQTCPCVAHKNHKHFS